MVLTGVFVEYPHALLITVTAIASGNALSADVLVFHQPCYVDAWINMRALNFEFLSICFKVDGVVAF